MDKNNKVVFVSYLINNRHYRTLYINGDNINAHFSDKCVGAVVVLNGELGNVTLHISYMKEEDFVMMLMSNCK